MKIHYTNTNQKKLGSAISISDKADFKGKKITRQKIILCNEKSFSLSGKCTNSVQNCI